MLSDNQLLRRYYADRSERDFEELVRRHADLVYAAALRHLNGDAGLSRDVTQMVFTDLARKAASLWRHQSIIGWLYLSTRFASAKLARAEQRRQIREETASTMSDVEHPHYSIDPQRLRPLIEEAMQELGEEDREAVLLRFFEDRDFRSLGNCLGLTHEAARKRVVRAVERLREVLERRGISSSQEAVETALSGASALVLPPDFHAIVLKAALAGSLRGSPSVTSPFLQFSNMKTALLLSGLAVGLATLTLVQRDSVARLRSENAALAARLAAFTKPSVVFDGTGDQALSKGELAQFRKDRSELLSLRDEVTRLRASRRQSGGPGGDPENEERLLAGQQVAIETKFVESPTATLKNLGLDTIGIDITGAGVTSILTEPQFKTLLQGIQAQSGIDVLAAPVLTTLHNRAASISVGPGGDSEGLNLGPTAEFFPVVLQDRLSISLQATAGLSERVPIADGAANGQKQVRKTRVAGTGVLMDGQTLVLAQRIGRTDNSTSREEDTRSLVVFVTPCLIDPAGNRIHPGEENSSPEASREATESIFHPEDSRAAMPE